MTSTTTSIPGPSQTAPGLVDAVIPTEPVGVSETSPRRRRALFPSTGQTSPVPGQAGLRRVVWVGSDGPLREAVRDHATAVGAELSDDLSSGPAACIVADAAALARDPRTLEGHRSPLLVVTGVPEIPVAVWQRSLAAGAQAVLALPDGSEELLTRLADLARPGAASLLLGVVAGSGGAGASSFAARLAGAARGHGPVTLVDADPLGGGLDLLVEAPAAEGIGWAETAGLGPDDGDALRESLPRVDDVHLLVARDAPGPEPRAVSRVLSSLSPLGGTVVVDLSPALVPAAVEHLDHLLVVVPATDHAVRSAARRLRSWQLAPGLAEVVVRREGPLSAREVSEDLTLPCAASFRDSTRGTVPLLDARRRGADRAARALITELFAGVHS